MKIDDKNKTQGAMPNDAAPPTSTAVSTEDKTNSVGVSGISNKDTISTARPLTDTQGIIGGVINSPIADSNDAAEDDQIKNNLKVDKARHGTHQTPFENFKTNPASSAGVEVKKTLVEQNPRDVMSDTDTRPVDLGPDITFGVSKEAPQEVSSSFSQEQKDLPKKNNAVE
jgi:hypothetical protein